MNWLKLVDSPSNDWLFLSGHLETDSWALVVSKKFTLLINHKYFLFLYPRQIHVGIITSLVHIENRKQFCFIDESKIGGALWNGKIQYISERPLWAGLKVIKRAHAWHDQRWRFFLNIICLFSCQVII